MAFKKESSFKLFIYSIVIGHQHSDDICIQNIDHEYAGDIYSKGIDVDFGILQTGDICTQVTGTAIDFLRSGDTCVQGVDKGIVH